MAVMCHHLIPRRYFENQFNKGMNIKCILCKLSLRGSFPQSSTEKNKSIYVPVNMSFNV